MSVRLAVRFAPVTRSGKPCTRSASVARTPTTRNPTEELMSRQRVTEVHVAELADALIPRDLAVVGSLDRVRVATGEQVRRLHFTEGVPTANARQAQRRLRELVARASWPSSNGASGAPAAAHPRGLRPRRGRSATGLGLRPGRGPAAPPALDARGRVPRPCPRRDRAVRPTDRAGPLRRAARLRCRAGLLARASPASAAGAPGSSPTPSSGSRPATSSTSASSRSTETPSRAAAIARKLAVYRRYFQTGREQERWRPLPQVVLLAPTERRRAALVELPHASRRRPGRSFGWSTTTNAIGALTGEAA